MLSQQADVYTVGLIELAIRKARLRSLAKDVVQGSAVYL